MPPLPQQSRECTHLKVRHSHATPAAYFDDRCRCFGCRLAVAAYRRGEPWESSLTPAIGVTRRLRALACLGWSSYELAPMLGHSAAFTVNDWRNGERVQTVNLASHAKVAAVYDRLSDQPSRGRYRLRVIRHAERNGWLPPIAYDDDTIDSVQMGYDNSLHTPLSRRNSLTAARFIDDIAVERRIAGDPVPLTRAELSQAWQTLERMGWSAAQIGLRLGVSSRTVQRYRQRQRAA